jgi:hypothetical protein
MTIYVLGRCSIKSNRIEESHTFPYEGEPNAFMIELLGFQDDVHER